MSDPTPGPQDNDESFESAPPPVPPAGWYDDGSGRLRWFDGARWTEHVQPVAGSPSGAPGDPTTSVVTGTSAEPERATTKYQVGDVVNGYRLITREDGSAEWVPAGAPATKSRRTLIVTLGSVGAVLLLLIVIGAINRPSTSNVSSAANSTTQEKEETKTPTKTSEPEPLEASGPKPEMVTLPKIIGLSASEAEAALTALGLKTSFSGDPAGKVVSFKPNVTRVEAGTTVTLTLEQAIAAPPEKIEQQPQSLTLSQQNAVGSARSYLNFMSFSRIGLIGQLEYEGYSTEDATFAVDYVAPDWYAQAGEKAAEYLNFMSFSREGLYDQLIYEGFTPDEVEAGLAAVGY